MHRSFRAQNVPKENILNVLFKKKNSLKGKANCQKFTHYVVMKKVNVFWTDLQ